MIRTATAGQALPRILFDCCGPAWPLDEPWLNSSHVYASDGRIVARAPADRFPSALVRLLRRGNDGNYPKLGHLFNRWQPDGRTLILPLDCRGNVPCPACHGDADWMPTCPACDGAGLAPDDRGRVRLAPGLDLAAYRVATLVAHGVREVRAGLVRPGEPAAPVRFGAGVVEGLLMPLREEVH